MEDYTLDDYDVDITVFFRDEIGLVIPPEEWEFTAESIAERLRITSNIVTRKMNKAVEDGKATSRMWRNEEGRRVSLYKWLK